VVGLFPRVVVMIGVKKLSGNRRNARCVKELVADSADNDLWK
jgi:hypothetical protein